MSHGRRRPLKKKINIFYQRVMGWQLHIADMIANGGIPLAGGEPMKQVRHSGFAVLHICLSYFETVGHCLGSNGRPAFKEGVRSVFPGLLGSYGADDSESWLEVLYVGARCGMYHNSMTVPGVGLGQPARNDVMAYDPVRKRLVISPERLPRALKEHLEQFRACLLDPSNVDLRCRFEHRFNEDHGIGTSRGTRL
jgi:hypothetical protein